MQNLWHSRPNHAAAAIAARSCNRGRKRANSFEPSASEGTDLQLVAGVAFVGVLVVAAAAEGLGGLFRGLRGMHGVAAGACDVFRVLLGVGHGMGVDRDAVLVGERGNAGRGLGRVVLAVAAKAGVVLDRSLLKLLRLRKWGEFKVILFSELSLNSHSIAIVSGGLQLFTETSPVYLSNRNYSNGANEPKIAVSDYP